MAPNLKSCKIKILTETEGGESSFETEGKLFFQGDGAVALYRQEGDFVTLKIGKDRFSMSRKERLSMQFVPQTLTQAEIFFENNHSSVPIFTSIYSPRQTSDGFSVALQYELRFSEPQKFLLKMEILFISEEV